jgi:glycosyltransferase involved in cell wall biosynthesis
MSLGGTNMNKEKKIRVLHSAALLRPPSGILNQMMWEKDAADELGLAWTTKMFCPSGCVQQSEIIHFSEHVKAEKKSAIKKLFDWIILRWDYHQWLRNQIEHCDVFLLRYYVHDPFQYIFVLFCKKPVYFVHHTSEVPELAMPGGWSGNIRSGLEVLIGRMSIRRSSGIVGVTNEIVEYEKYRAKQYGKITTVYPNGITSANPPISDTRTDTPVFLFVCSFFSAWHGLDLLLDAMDRNNKEHFVLHLVGELSQKDQERAVKDKRIVLHGKKNQEEIRVIATSCWVGLSSFALYRKRMNEACTLKVREYLMMGLPVYAGYKEVFPDSFPFYSRGDADIAEMMKFSRSVRGVSRSSVVDCARPYIEKSGLLSELYVWLSNQIVEV